MSIATCFAGAARAESVGAKTFYVVTAISAILVVFPKPEVEAWLHPVLIVAAAVAIACTTITTICQTRGNRLLREAQLSNALGAGIGEKVRDDYFNTSLPPSFLRLAATTLENTLFTREVLARMLVTERIKIAAYAGILLLLLSIRSTSTGWLLLLAQTLFSADLLLEWMRMERFRLKTEYVHESLRQFFLQDGSVQKVNGMAIVVAAFTNYECAKDEASLPLDTPTFDRLNPELTQRWEQMKMQLKIELDPK